MLRRRLPAGRAHVQEGNRRQRRPYSSSRRSTTLFGGPKNAIGWASRPWGQNSFTRKPSAIIGTSPGSIGTAVAQQSLRGVLAFCSSPLMNSVEAYIQFKPDLINADGEVTVPSTKEFLANYMTEFHASIVRVLTVLPRNA